MCRPWVLLITGARPSPHITPIQLVIDFKEKMLEGLGGFNVESRLGEESEKRGRRHNKAVKKRGVRGVVERGMWSKRVV